jgi:hypothetical protein
MCGLFNVLTPAGETAGKINKKIPSKNNDENL